jgi:Nif-specific regulatory protein
VWPGVGGDDRDLTAVLEISQGLLAAPDCSAGLLAVLRTIGAYYGTRRSAVSLLDAVTGEVCVVAAVVGEDGDDTGDALGGMTIDRIATEGIAADVARTGKPVVVPRMDDDPRFRRAPLRCALLEHEEGSYVCMPIVLEQRPVGALWVESVSRTDEECEHTARVLGVVCSIIAHAIKVHRAADDGSGGLLDPGMYPGTAPLDAEGFANIIGSSGPMLDVYEQIAQVAPAMTTVLVRGESGTGKELIAQAIHTSSPRSDRPFIKVNCAALPQDLIESELFGYEAGAFTGATQAKRGRFELAEGGTLFLDEIGDVNRATQVKLLRVLQAREFERLGGTQTIRANVRLVTATNQDLEKAMHAGDFRDDLYYRLNVFAITVPALRDRRSDILPLAYHFLDAFCRTLGRRVTRIAAPAARILMSYHWPGNVRELENAIERGVVVCNSGVLHASHLPPALHGAAASRANQLSLRQATEAFEKEIVQEALKSALGRRSTAARLLKTTRRVLNYKVRRYNIDWQRFRIDDSAATAAQLRAVRPHPRTS